MFWKKVVYNISVTLNLARYSGQTGWKLLAGVCNTEARGAGWKFKQPYSRPA